MKTSDEHRKILIKQARNFRKDPTKSEDILWQEIRNRQLHGVKFRRQVPIGPFIVDFLCKECRLVLEVDGPVHQGQKVRDHERQQMLEKDGYQVLRVTSEEVEENLITCLSRIQEALTRADNR